jgi:tRNA A37 threonylcarbamoyladenosine modification protein TsaB
MASQILYTDLPVVPILHSRKGEAFTAQFTWNDTGELIRSGDDNSLKFEAFPSLFQKPTLFVGNDYGNQGPAINKLLGSLAHLAPACFWNLRASSIGSLALKKFLLGDLDDPYLLNPVYLRPPDIQPNPFSPISKTKSPP